MAGLKPVTDGEIAERSIAEVVYAHLLEAIQDGTFPPYTKLVQEQIAEQMHVSRTPVRDALNRLAQESLVAWMPGRGYITAGVTEDGIRQVHSVRVALERLGVTESLERYGPEDVARLRRLNDEVQTADPRSTDLFERNRRFHMALIAPSGNQVLVRLLTQLWALPATRSIADRYIDGGPRTEQSSGEHGTMIDLIERKQGDKLLVLLTEHIDRSYQYATLSPIPDNRT